MDEQAMKDRTRQFALRVMKLAEALPNSVSGQVLAKQIVRAATSVGANTAPLVVDGQKLSFAPSLGLSLKRPTSAVSGWSWSWTPASSLEKVLNRSIRKRTS